MTPEQVDRMDAARVARIPLIAEMVDKHRAEQMQKNHG